MDFPSYWLNVWPSMKIYDGGSKEFLDDYKITHNGYKFNQWQHMWLRISSIIVEDVRMLLSFFRDVKIKYYSRLINRNANGIEKKEKRKLINNLVYSLVFLWSDIIFLLFSRKKKKEKKMILCL